MKTKEIRHKARYLHAKHGLYSLDLPTVKKIIKDEGYTIIEYSHFDNTPDVEIVIHSLKLEELLVHSDGFTFANEDFRLVLINKDLNEREKTVLLAHEAGHIVCGHMSHKSILGNAVLEEDEANQFVHFLLRPNLPAKIEIFTHIHKKTIIAVVVTIIALIVGLSFYQNYQTEKKYYEQEFYVTESGERYHQKNCMHIVNKVNARRLTKEEYDSQTYTPCQVCLPEG